MSFDHQSIVAFAKSYGLFFLIGMAIIALVYALWPGNRKRFDKAARDIIEDEDEPWQ